MGDARLVTGARFLLYCATGLWIPVLLIPGDTTAGSITYATVRSWAGWLGLPPVDGILSPGEVLLLFCALFLTLFSTVDYLTGTGSRFPQARVYLATIFWVGLATSYLLANPRAYGTWLFVMFAALSIWCLRRVRASGEGKDGAGA